VGGKRVVESYKACLAADRLESYKVESKKDDDARPCFTGYRSFEKNRIK